MNAQNDGECTENAAREARQNSGSRSCSYEEAASANHSDNVSEASTPLRSQSAEFTKAVYYWVLSRF